MSAPESSSPRAGTLETTSKSASPERSDATHASAIKDVAAGASSDPSLEFSPETSSRLGVLRHKHYRNVIIAQMFSNLGVWSEFYAIQVFIAQATGRLDDQGVLGVCQNAPVLVFGIIGGLAADRVDRKWLLIVTQVLAGLVAAGVAIVTAVHFENPRTAVNWLFGLGVAYGIVMAFNFPAWQVVTPRLVPRHELTKAITLNGIMFNLARAIGPALAGLALAHVAPWWLLAFNALTFIMMAGVVATTPPAPAPPRTDDHVWRQIAEAAGFLVKNPGPRAVLVAIVLFSVLAAPLVRLLSNFVLDVYRVPTEDAANVGGWLLAAMGAGAVIAGIALRRIPSWYPKHHFIPISAFGLGLSITVFASTSSVWLGYATMVICGWFWIWAFNQAWAAMQVLTPDRLRGRAMSVMNVSSFGAMAVGVYVAGETGASLHDMGVMTAHDATRFSVLMLSIPLVIAGLVMMAWRVPEVDNMPRKKGASRKSRSLIEAVTASEHRPRPDAGQVEEPGPQPV